VFPQGSGDELFGLGAWEKARSWIRWEADKKRSDPALTVSYVRLGSLTDIRAQVAERLLCAVRTATRSVALEQNLQRLRRYKHA